MIQKPRSYSLHDLRGESFHIENSYLLRGL
jgi:hypothetical protein